MNKFEIANHEPSFLPDDSDWTLVWIYVFYYDGMETAHAKGSIFQVQQFILLTTEVKRYRQGDGLSYNAEGEKSLGDSFVVDYIRVFGKVK